jgi:hypothetical protein
MLCAGGVGWPLLGELLTLHQRHELNRIRTVHFGWVNLSLHPLNEWYVHYVYICMAGIV